MHQRPLEALFDVDYQKISVEEFRATYVGESDQRKISDDYLRLLMDRVVEKDVEEYYRYHPAYDGRSPMNSASKGRGRVALVLGCGLLT